MGNAVSSLRIARSLDFWIFFEWYKMKVKYTLASTMMSMMKVKLIFSIFKEIYFLISSFQIVKTIHLQEIK